MSEGGREGGRGGESDRLTLPRAVSNDGIEQKRRKCPVIFNSSLMVSFWLT